MYMPGRFRIASMPSSTRMLARCNSRRRCRRRPARAESQRSRRSCCWNPSRVSLGLQGSTGVSIRWRVQCNSRCDALDREALIFRRVAQLYRDSSLIHFYNEDDPTSSGLLNARPIASLPNNSASGGWVRTRTGSRCAGGSSSDPEPPMVSHAFWESSGTAFRRASFGLLPEPSLRSVPE